MKIVCLILVTICGLLSQFAYADDAAYQQEIIGTWVMGEEDEHFGKGWFTLEYKSDGTTLYQTYKTAKCEQVDVIVRGSWVIQNGKLINTALSGSGGYKVPLGLTFVDTILTLKDGEMVLKTYEGQTAYRSKNRACG